MYYLFKFGLLNIVNIYNVLLILGVLNTVILITVYWNCGCRGPIKEYREGLVFQSNIGGNFSIDDI
jgi:hypothetical protein